MGRAPSAERVREIIRDTTAYLCIDCSKCTGSCPIGKAGSVYSPRALVQHLVLEGRDLRVHLDALPVAMIMTFDYNESIYLYNSAYNPDYSHLSVGILSKILCLRDSINKGKQKWDFLKGGESYKHRIGGREVALSRCRIEL